MATMVPEARPYSTKVNPNGRIVIPAALREQMGIKPGDFVTMQVVDGALRVESNRAKIRRIQESMLQYIEPGRLISEELIAERREEARREMEE